jgi:two-component system CheB/CheR fusion protein
MSKKVQPEYVKGVSAARANSYVVAIGASAGGLEAIHEFFDHMPGNSSCSFIVIQHLSSDYKSLLVELVSKHTHMKVFEAAENMNLQPDCVYIIPNNKLLTISNHRLKLADKVLDKSPNTAIDNFLFSLAHDKREKAIAIILSGTGTDGTKGIEAIKECGGMVMVQDPDTAKFDGMPKSAITSGNADVITVPSKMHEELFAYTNQEPIQILENGKINDDVLNELFNLVHQHSGHDFNLYKTPTIIRRIARRMNHTGINKLDKYVAYLQENEEEVKALGKDFLIGVTKFFRDKPAFDLLAGKIIPEIIDSKEDNDTLKVWICACSTGEEAYSVAILIDHYLQQTGKELDVKIFATDIDEASLEVASRNVYPEAIAKEIEPELLEKYFIKEGQYYSVVTHIRKQIVFARHNVIKAPPFIKNDLICCRNMLIYMNALLQQKVLSTFHFSLNQGGFLFLGSSETASAIKEGMHELSSKWKLYRKIGPVTQPAHNSYYSNGQALISEIKKPVIKAEKATADAFKDFLVNDLGYVGIFVDKNYEIKETIGDFKKYLSLPDRKLELNILKMVPQELSFMLNTALRQCWKDNKDVHFKRVRIKRDNEDVYVNLSVKPPVPNASKPFTLIVFNEIQLDNNKEDIIIPSTGDEHHKGYVLELESELTEVRGNLQMAVEEMETTNEELQSSNEELLSANEELQSSNEELQSLNEELHTLNTEHQLKIKELIDLNDDLNNYFKSVDIGQIFVDTNTRIRKFNPAAVSMVNLIEADIGRPINHISNNIKYDHFLEDINQVQHSDDLIIEKEIELKSGKHCLMRILPYIRKDKQKDGVVITFVDISTVTELSNIVSGVFSTSLSAIMVFNAVRDSQGHITDFDCLTANNMAARLLNKREEELQHALLARHLPQLLQNNLLDKFKKVVETGQNLQTEVQFENRGWLMVLATKIADGFAVTYTDITERKQAEQKLKKNYNELISTRENLKTLNNELEEKIKERTLRLSQSEERFKLVSQATNDTIWDWDMATNVMWRSDNFTAMFGYSNGTDTGNISYWFDKIHPEDRKEVEQSVYHAINNGQKHWSAEYRFMKADGKYATILDRGNILHDEYHTPYRMVGSIVDISRITEAEKRVDNSEKRFKKVFESNMIGMIFTDASGYIIDANNAFLQMLGYTEQDVHKGALRWNKLTPGEYLKISERADQEVQKNGFCPPFEKEYFKKDGSRVPVLMGSARLDEDGMTNAVTYIIDLTRQKEVEKNRRELQGLIKKQQDEFYSIFMNAPALISIRRGKNLRYEFTNKAFDEFYGRHNFIGKTTAEAHADMRPSKLFAGDAEVMKTGEPFTGKAFNLKRLDPVSRQWVDTWFDFLFTPVYNDKDEIDGIAFFGFEVTDLVKAQQSTKELMQRKDEFMSIASHELKTPITSLRGSLQIAQRMADKGEKNIQSLYPFIIKANKQTTRLTTLVEDLLDVTRIHAGKMRFNYTWFNAGEMIRECMEDTQAHTTSHQFELKGNADVQIYADRHRLEQVLSNFMSNAVKYSPDTDRIFVTNEITDHNMLKVSVQDFGIGIPADKKDMVFDRFFRVQESSQKFSGLGLGLYITAEIINRHQGKIGVDSVEHHGSTFWFCIPLTQTEEIY